MSRKKQGARRLCESCRWYEPLLDVCAKRDGVRSWKPLERGCGLWEAEQKREAGHDAAR